MCDLTGFSRSRMVDKSYGHVLDMFLPRLSKKHLMSGCQKSMKRHLISHYDSEEEVRPDYLFPLPLSLCYYNGKFECAKKKKYQDEFVKLLVASVDNLMTLYPTFIEGSSGVLQHGFDSGWFGGVEFTLKRKDYMPSLQTLCRKLLSMPSDVSNDDLVRAAASEQNAKSDSAAASKSTDESQL